MRLSKYGVVLALIAITFNGQSQVQAAKDDSLILGWEDFTVGTRVLVEYRMFNRNSSKLDYASQHRGELRRVGNDVELYESTMDSYDRKWSSWEKMNRPDELENIMPPQADVASVKITIAGKSYDAEKISFKSKFFENDQWVVYRLTEPLVPNRPFSPWFGNGEPWLDGRIARIERTYVNRQMTNRYVLEVVEADVKVKVDGKTFTCFVERIEHEQTDPTQKVVPPSIEMRWMSPQMPGMFVRSKREDRQGGLMSATTVINVVTIARRQPQAGANGKP